MQYKPESNEERRFLDNYDPYLFKAPSIAADTALFAWDFPSRSLKLLLIRRGNFPYRGRWALPGGFVDVGEDIAAAAERELLEETGVCGIAPVLNDCLGAPDRDPRHHIVSPEYIALTAYDRVTVRAGDDAAHAAWFTVSDWSKTVSSSERTRTTVYSYVLQGSGFALEPVVVQTEEYGLHKRTAITISDSASIAFDHAKAIMLAIRGLRHMLRQTDIAFNALPERFTRDELEALYAAAFLDVPDKLPGLREEDGLLTLLP